MGVRLSSSLMIISLLVLILSVSVLSVSEQQIKHWPQSFFGSQELFSPGDWIKVSQIKVYDNRVIIDLEGASWTTFTNTNSMDPFLDETAHAIEISPQSAEAINVGDVVSYQTSLGIIIHRVVEKGEDSEGIYYLVKGDNNNLIDPVRVRFSDIVGVVVAVVY